jgi:hypothetical protein
MGRQFIDIFSVLFLAICKTIPGITKLTRHFKVVRPSFPNTPLLTGANKWRCCLLAAHQSLTTMRACMHAYVRACVCATRACSKQRITTLSQIGPIHNSPVCQPLFHSMALQKIRRCHKNIALQKKLTANRIFTVPSKSDGTGLVKLQPSEPVLKEPITVLTVSRCTSVHL